MILNTSLPILGRRNSSLLLLNLHQHHHTPLTFTRAASRLSGIHEGLRRSERFHPQGPPRREIRSDPQDEPYLTPDERRRQRALARRNPLTFKIHKGKKDITQQPGPPARGALSRLGDPRDPVGSHSLLKKFKTGSLVNELRSENEDNKDGIVSADRFQQQLLADEIETIRDSRNAPLRVKRRKQRQKYDLDAPLPPINQDNWGQRADEFQSPARGRDAERGSFSRDDRIANSMRGSRSWDQDQSFERSGDRRSRDDFSTGWEGHEAQLFNEDAIDSGKRSRTSGRNARSFGELRREREAAREAAILEARQEARLTRPNRQREAARGYDDSPESDSLVRRVEVREPGEEGEDDMFDNTKKKHKHSSDPISIPYTTAASQFLYGTTAVESALKAERRLLYKLYIYRGSNRLKKFQDEAIAKLATRRRVEIEYVTEDNMRMLDKMSDGRPHNGYVLEASPLPHMPVRALGEVSDERSMPGFRVVAGHQSAEEVLINGANEFVETGANNHHQYKPFVLLLDSVLDPGNLGAILRTACFMGVTAVATTKRGTAPITPVVLKASAGAAEVLKLFSVESAVDFLQGSQENGWKVFAACPPKGNGQNTADLQTIERMDPLSSQPCILVLGGEGEGLSNKVRNQADTVVSIPNMSGSRVVDSLNVSVATGLLCSSFTKKANAAATFGVDDGDRMF